MKADLKKQEELKRDRHWDPQVRWNVLQETISWAEAQATVLRNTPAERLKEQARKLSTYP